MEEKIIKEIEAFCNYKFINKALIKQALTVKAYAQENGGEDNELLELIGDCALNYAVLTAMVNNYTYNDKNQFYLDNYNEEKLTELKKDYVEGYNEARIIFEHKLNCYLILGNGDRKQNKGYLNNLMENLFESLLGAVVIDSNNNLELIYKSALNMLGLKEGNLQELEAKRPLKHLEKEINDFYYEYVYLLVKYCNKYSQQGIEEVKNLLELCIKKFIIDSNYKAKDMNKDCKIICEKYNITLKSLN